nr:hypothetical protein [Tanacetum cinerariifolium]
MIKFMLNTQQFTYTVDMFRDTLHLPVETPKNPFVALANIHTIEAFLKKVGYQGVVDKKKEAIQYPRFNKLIVADIMKKFPNIPKRLEEDYHSIKDDAPFFSVSVDDDDDDDDDKEREKQDGEMGSLEVRNEEKQTTIPSPLTSPRKILSSDKKTFQELTDIVSNPTISTSKQSTVKKRISSKYSYLPGALRMMCRRQGYMIQDMERNYVTTAKFWETYNKIDEILHEEFKAHALAIIKELFKNHVQSNVIHVHPTITTSTETESSANLQYQLYLKIKRNLQDRADDIILWEALRGKFEKSSSNTSCREDDFHSHHEENQDNDAPPEGEKRLKRSKESKRSKSAKRSSSKHSRKDSTTYVSKPKSQQQEWDAWEEENVIDENEEKKYILSLHMIYVEEFPKPDLEEKLNRLVWNEFKTFNEDARITEVFRIVIDQPHGLDFIEQILEIDNQKVKLMNSLITFIKSCVIWEGVYDFQLGIESYQMKINLIALAITFPGIKEHAPYTIVDEPQIGLIYLNSKDEKRVMYLEEIVKFCDATLEKVLNELSKVDQDLRPTLYDEKVIGLGYTLMFLTHFDEALEIEKFKRSRENKIKFAYDYGNLNATNKFTQVDEPLKKDLEDLFQDFYDEYFDSSKIMKSSTTNVETSNNEEVFHEVSESFEGESSSSSLNDDVQQSPEEVILPQTNTQSIPINMIPNGDEASTSHNVFNERSEDAYFDASTSFHDPSNVSAMQEELDQFARLKVWRLVPRPKGKYVIKTKWIFKNKKDESSLVIRNKARLIAVGTINLGLWYSKDSGFDLTAYSDANHAGCHLDRKTESEYVAVSGCCAQVLWMRTQLTDYGFFYDKVPIYCYSKSAIAISCNL